MLSSTVDRVKYIGNSSASVYSYGCRIFSTSDLLVTVKNTTTLIETTLVLTTDYTVGGVGQASGNITLVNSSQAWLSGGDLATGYIMVIRRKRPLTQNTSIRNQSAFYGATHEDTFDNQTMVSQQQQDEIDRSVKLPETLTSSDFNPILPTSIAGAAPNSGLVINSLGTGFAIASPLTGISWQRADIAFSSLQAASTTNSINAFSLPAGYILLGLAIKHSIAFAGTLITAVKLDVGIGSDKNKFISALDVLASVSDSAFDYVMANYISSWANDTSITLQATATGANLSALSQGYVSVYYLIQKVGV